MFKLGFTLTAPVVFVLCSIGAATVPAQPSQKFVSARNGRDFNPCTVQLPCRTFAAALLQVPPRGEIIALDAGDYGPVTINKSVTIAGPAGGNAGIRVGSGPAITIEAAASDIVVLRGLTINGSGLRGPLLIPEAPGVLFKSGEALHIENCVINGFFGDGVSFAGAGQLFVKDTMVRNCSRAGLSIGTSAGTAAVFIDRCRFEKNDREGVTASANAKVTIRDSVAAGNTDYGFAVLASFRRAAEMNLENCVATGNGIGIFATGGIAGGVAIVRVSNSTITGNTAGVRDTEGGSILSRLNNTVEGNENNGSFTGTFQAK